MALLRVAAPHAESDATSSGRICDSPLSPRALPATLSGGLRRRLQVCCAIIASPPLAVLDEPTTGLDAESRREIWTLIKRELAGGCGALVTTHMMSEAEALCTKVVVVEQGELAAQGTPVKRATRKRRAGAPPHLSFARSRVHNRQSPGAQGTLRQWLQPLHRVFSQFHLAESL